MLGVWFSRWALQKLEEKDPQIIVVDEVVGQSLVLAVAPITPTSYLLAFMLFRLFDICKPWPIYLIDKKMKGPVGIMFDDVVAGLLALFVTQGLLGILG